MQPQQRQPIHQPYTEDINDELMKTLGTKQSQNVYGNRGLGISVNEQEFLHESIYHWSIEPYIRNRDTLRPGQSMTDLNRVLADEERQPMSYTPDQAEDWTDLCLSFCAAILHNISTKT